MSHDVTQAETSGQPREHLTTTRPQQHLFIQSMYSINKSVSAVQLHASILASSSLSLTSSSSILPTTLSSSSPPSCPPPWAPPPPPSCPPPCPQCPAAACPGDWTLPDWPPADSWQSTLWLLACVTWCGEQGLVADTAGPGGGGCQVSV